MAAKKQNPDKMRASRIRNKRPEKVTPEEAAWFAAYEKNKTKSTIRGAKMVTRNTPVGTQHALPGVGPVMRSRAAHATVKQDTGGRMDPKNFTWTPIVPAAPEGGAPLPDGAKAPPAPGTPIVGGPVGPTPVGGDPAAAEQFAKLIGFITMLGVNAALAELATGELEIPDQLRGLLTSEGLANGTVETVMASAKNVALKYGFKSVPLADEATVAGAVAGSVFLLSRQATRKKKPPGGGAAPAIAGVIREQPAAAAAPVEAPDAKPPATPEAPFAGMTWGGAS